jgi:hypothetical protein
MRVNMTEVFGVAWAEAMCRRHHISHQLKVVASALAHVSVPLEHYKVMS